MASYYRIRSASRSVRPGSRQPSSERREMQRSKPALERTLARLEPAGISEGDDAWPVIDELLHDWVYEA